MRLACSYNWTGVEDERQWGRAAGRGGGVGGGAAPLPVQRAGECSVWLQGVTWVRVPDYTFICHLQADQTSLLLHQGTEDERV